MLISLIILQTPPNSRTPSDDDDDVDETPAADVMVDDDDDIERGVDGRQLSTDDEDEYSQTIFKVHVGKNLHCRAKKASNTVDIRHSFFRNMSTTSEHPTQRGIKMTKYEFTKLLGFLPQLETKWSGLAGLAACYTTHTTLDNLQACHHCTPKPSPPRPLHNRCSTSSDMQDPNVTTSTAATIDEGSMIQ